MGFSGSFVLCRSEADFQTLRAVCSRDEGLVWSTELGDGWRVGQWAGSAFADDASEMLIDLIAETGAPALTGYVTDSDCVDVNGLGLSTPPWRACLGRTATAHYLEEVDLALDQVFPDPSTSARHAVAWAHDAGLVPHEEGLGGLFAVEEPDVLADDMFFDLLTNLGVPGA